MALRSTFEDQKPRPTCMIFSGVGSLMCISQWDADAERNTRPQPLPASWVRCADKELTAAHYQIFRYTDRQTTVRCSIPLEGGVSRWAWASRNSRGKLISILIKLRYCDMLIITENAGTAGIQAATAPEGRSAGIRGHRGRFGLQLWRETTCKSPVLTG